MSSNCSDIERINLENKGINVNKIRMEEILVPYRLLQIKKSNPITKSKLSNIPN